MSKYTDDSHSDTVGPTDRADKLLRVNRPLVAGELYFNAEFYSDHDAFKETNN